MSLDSLVVKSASRYGSRYAVEASDGCITYQELDELANRIARALYQRGVRAGDRVGIWLEKSTTAIATMQGILRLHAAYVPLDPLSPAPRVIHIIQDCHMAALVTTRQRYRLLGGEELPCLCVDSHADGTDATMSWDSVLALPADGLSSSSPDIDDLAYILYTSGSTGIPKGVCISHGNALAFIEWAVETLQVVATDRLANHAPFHFDLSVLDLYAAFSVGATVVLIPEELAYLPGRLVAFLRERQLTIWYSVPSVLMLMLEQGDLLAAELPALRAVLFAGEPFPVKHLRRLFERWPGKRFLNLYGPTETNVCTFYEVTRIAPEETLPVPIGRACSGDTVWAQKADGGIAREGEEGELLVSGPTVMLGYWGREMRSTFPYATGDLVRVLADGNFQYVGRLDHMVKIRGYRVEPGEIEAALNTHPSIREVAVLVRGEGIQARLVAFLSWSGQQPDSSSANELSLLEIKRYCAERLPRYMIVDSIRVLAALPRTRNGKIDRLALAADEALAGTKGV